MTVIVLKKKFIQELVIALVEIDLNAGNKWLFLKLIIQVIDFNGLIMIHSNVLIIINFIIMIIISVFWNLKFMFHIERGSLKLCHSNVLFSHRKYFTFFLSKPSFNFPSFKDKFFFNTFKNLRLWKVHHHLLIK